MNPAGAAANKVAELIACSDDPGESFSSAEKCSYVPHKVIIYCLQIVPSSELGLSHPSPAS
jgi:hypothetical protein